VPYIQVDLPEGLSAAEKAGLCLEVRERVHRAIGSPREFINVVLREWPRENLLVAGETPRGHLEEVGSTH
jgi:phenylpyruvate tautomerase PptA (4-oxalocrotonate tautomerase family)